MSKILSAADVQSRLEDMCDVDGLDKAKKAREVYGVMQTISTQNAALRAVAREALDVLTRLADSAAYWSDYDVPVGIVAEIDAAKARLAGVLNG